MVTNTNTVRE